MTKEPTVRQKMAAAERADKWAGAGKEAFALAVTAETKALQGELLEPTKKNIETTIRGAMKLFLDGKIIDPKIKEKLATAGLDMNNLRQTLVEQTVARAIPQIINSGDIERLAQLGLLAGEPVAPVEDVPQNARRITRERVIVELDD